MGKPDNVIDCWFVSEEEAETALKNKRPFCEYINPYNYFLEERSPNPTTRVGRIGHRDVKEDFHSLMISHFTYFRDYQERKKLYVTFDQTVLYLVTEIFPSNPLLFTLRQVSNQSLSSNMINQEEIYRLLLKEQWADIIKILHKNKAEIANEASLTHAANTFEQVFVSKIQTLSVDDKEIAEALQSAYLIHHGRFYKFSDSSIKTIAIQLARRLPIKEAYDYVKDYEDNPIAMMIIKEYNEKYFDPEKSGHKRRQVSYNWAEIFNRLFELINDEKNVWTYFSGQRFIQVVKEILPYHPDYPQFIELRKKGGRSISRKMFFYDILMDADEHSRTAIVEKILTGIRSFHPDKVKAIEILMGKEKSSEYMTNGPVLKPEPDRCPVVFISYSWEDEEHKEWVLKLAGRLAKDGIKVILDRYHLGPGKSLPVFVEQSIASADRILIIFTPNYRRKADARNGGVGYEYSIMNADLYRNQVENDKVIPVLRRGTMEESIPSFMRQYIHLDLTDDSKFEASYTELVRDIYNDPAIKAPPIGARPVFE